MNSPKRRNLLFLCAVLDSGGAERHWAGLLPSLRERGFGIRLVALRGGGRALDHLRSERIPVRELGLSGFASLTLLPTVLREVRAGADAIVTFGYNAHAIGALAARAAGVPHVLNWHRQPGWPMSKVEAGTVRLAAGVGAGAIAVTRAQIPDLVRLGFRQERISVVPNGVAGPKRHTDRDLLRAELGLPSKGFVAVLVARLRPEKRIIDFIDAIASLRESLPGAQGVVVGDGPLADELRRQAVDRNAPVRLVGYQAEPDQWMVAADVVCLTSSYEALPMALVEALACGRPCIATDVGGAGELVEDGVNGRLLPVEDVPRLTEALRGLASNPILRREMGDRSLERWRSRFAFDTMADSYSQLLGTVAGMPIQWSP